MAGYREARNWRQTHSQLKAHGATTVAEVDTLDFESYR